MKQQIIPANHGPDYDWSKDHIFVKTHSTLTDGRITLVEDTLKPGFHLPRHYHKAMIEVFYILEGEVVFAFDDETAIATPGTTVNIPPGVIHEVTCAQGGKLLTIFSPGGFDRYLEELTRLSAAQLEDTALLQSLAEQYDTWMA